MGLSLSGAGSSAGRLLRTVRHLKPVQIVNRIQRRMVRPVPRDLPAPPLRAASGLWVAPVSRRRHWDDEATFTFLNQARRIDRPDGWNAPGIDKLWLYNLHYFDDLGEPSADGRIAAHRQLIRDWISDNPAPVGNGWEPYPVSLRVVNWIKWHLATGALDGPALRSLARQARHLAANLEYHLLGNHILANAKALVFAGLFFEGAEASGWLALGLRLLRRELAEQVLPDGGHFELSPVYHAVICEDVLDLSNLGRTMGSGDIEAWQAVAVRMLGWLTVMVRPDGALPLFNDAAYEVSPTAAQLAAYADRLGIAAPSPNEGLLVLPDSGYVRYASGRIWTIFDYGQVGPDYIPGHAHCDMFGFELAIDGRPVIVDTGTSTYEAGPTRLRQRGTAAHNTVQLGSHEQSEIWGAFRLGRRAGVIGRQVGADSVSAAHTGYRSFGIEPRRAVRFASERIVIEDELRGRQSPEIATARFHFHPDVQPRLDGREIDFGSGRLRFDGALAIGLDPYGYAPQFNIEVPATVVEVSFDRALRTEITFGGGG